MRSQGRFFQHNACWGWGWRKMSGNSIPHIPHIRMHKRTDSYDVRVAIKHAWLLHVNVFFIFILYVRVFLCAILYMCCCSRARLPKGIQYWVANYRVITVLKGESKKGNWNQIWVWMVIKVWPNNNLWNNKSVNVTEIKLINNNYSIKKKVCTRTNNKT